MKWKKIENKNKINTILYIILYFFICLFKALFVANKANILYYYYCYYNIAKN